MKNRFKDLLFDGWQEWLAYTVDAIIGLLTFLASIFCSIFIGILSLVVYLYKRVKHLVMAYPIPTLALLCITLAVCLLFMFIHYSAKLKSCQIERDSVAYEKKKLEQAFIGDTIIVRGYRTRDIKMSTLDE